MYGNTYYWPNLSQGLRARASTCSSSSNLFIEKGISDVLQQTRQRKNGGFPAETRIFEKNGTESWSERNFPPKFCSSFNSELIFKMEKGLKRAANKIE